MMHGGREEPCHTKIEEKANGIIGLEDITLEAKSWHHDHPILGTPLVSMCGG